MPHLDPTNARHTAHAILRSRRRGRRQRGRGGRLRAEERERDRRAEGRAAGGDEDREQKQRPHGVAPFSLVDGKLEQEPEEAARAYCEKYKLNFGEVAR